MRLGDAGAPEREGRLTGTRGSRGPARPRQDPPPEVPPRKGERMGGRRRPGLPAPPPPAAPPPSGGLDASAAAGGPGAGLGPMAPGAARRARRRVRGAPPAGARARSAEDWWWDRLVPSGSGYHLLQSDSMLLLLPGPGPARPRAQRRAARRAQRLLPAAARAPAAKARPRAAPAPEPPRGPDPGWGDRIPLEILLQIFGLLVAAEGPMPFLGRYPGPSSAAAGLGLTSCPPRGWLRRGWGVRAERVAGGALTHACERAASLGRPVRVPRACPWAEVAAAS